MAATRNTDNTIEFQSSAFDVVSSWLLGARSASASEGSSSNETNAHSNSSNRGASGHVSGSSSNTTKRASVTLYRPSASAKPSLTGRNNGATTTGANAGANFAAADGRALTEQEKEMRKKLLRKSGTYVTAAALEAEAESALKADREEALDKEERELVAARTALSSSSAKASSALRAGAFEAPHTTDDSGTRAATQAAETSTAPLQSTPTTAPGAAPQPLKKRKLNAQDALLEKLRQDAERARTKNQKQKQRMQRKKAQKQNAVTAAAPTDSSS